MIKAAGFRWRKAKVVLTSKDPDYRAKLDAIQRILSTLQEDEAFFSIDEYGSFAVKCKGGRKRVGPGERYVVQQWQKSKGWTIITALLSCPVTMGQITVQRVQLYFNGFADSPLRQESREKIWTVLSSVMASAIKYGCLTANPCHGVKLPAAKHGRSPKPHITLEQFNLLVELIPEPYASMVFVSTLTGLRISELAGLRWNDIGQDSITIDERFC
jgi:hypothetical protein